MKIIFSRKGFDSGSGKFPSPLFPDGKMLSLPIPDINSIIKYEDIVWNKYNVGEVVENITNGKIKSNYRAHLDPDLSYSYIPRKKDWQPIFGQEGAAQGHLQNQGIASGDLFLFFGLFQKVIVNKDNIKFAPNSSPKHILWGWLQIERSMLVDNIDQSQFEWALYHPHFQRKKSNTNTIYLAKEKLDIKGLERNKISGAGIFSKFSSKLQLTSNESQLSFWKLPSWMLPKENDSTLTYHTNLERWKKGNCCCYLQTVGRGQEFVLNSSNQLEARKWIRSLFTDL